MTRRALQEQADQTSKALGLRIIRILEETFGVNENQVFLFLERLEPIDKRFRPKSFSAGPPALWKWHLRGSP
jgi:hypothetical protein